MKPILFLTLLFSLNAGAQNYPRPPQWFLDDSARSKKWYEAHPEDKPGECHHIYIAIQSDTLIWDKKVRILTATYSGSTGMDEYVEPKPTPIKIVCLLCHKQTEQKIKIINEQK